MTRRTNARVAGFTFLIYIAVSLVGMVLFDRAAGAEGTAAKLAGIAQHASIVRVAVILELLGCICARVLAVTSHVAQPAGPRRTGLAGRAGVDPGHRVPSLAAHRNPPKPDHGPHVVTDA